MSRQSPRSLLLCLVLVAASPAAADIEFVDVTEASGLDFVGHYGTDEPFQKSVLGDQYNASCGIGDPSPYYMARNMGNGAAVGDYDRDGDLDVYVVGNIGRTDKLFRNNLYNGGVGEGKTFSDVTAQAFGLGAGETQDLGLSRFAQFVDLDQDGDADLVVLNDDDPNASSTPLPEPSRVFRNNGDGTFSDVSDTANFRPYGYLHAGMTVGDYDADGDLDLYTTVWTGECEEFVPTFPGLNQLFRNVSSNGLIAFEDATASAALQGFKRESFSAIFHDFTGDLYPELFVAVDEAPDIFYFNNFPTTGKFSNGVSSTQLNHVANDMGIAPADYDGDGDLDLYVTNITDTFDCLDPDSQDCIDYLNSAEERNVLWTNDQAQVGLLRFVDRAVERGVANTHWGWGTEWLDAENDGDLDLVAVNGFDEFLEWLALGAGESPEAIFSSYQRPSVLFENVGQNQFDQDTTTELEDFPDDSRALIAFDYDRDGDRDLLITNVDQPMRLFENQSTGQGNWLHLRLQPDHRAFGAVVRATLPDERVVRRDLIPGRSYLSGIAAEVHFGLGAVDSVPSLEITWADGSAQLLETPAINTVHTVTYVPEPGAAMAATSALLALVAIRTAGVRRREV